MFKILAIDGGGVRGVVPGAVIDRAGARSIDKFDVFAGTSIGAMLVAYLGVRPADDKPLVDTFKSIMPKIFQGYHWRKYSPFTPTYSDKALNQALQRLLPGKFGDLPKQTYITAVDLNRRTLKVFDSTDLDDKDWSLWEVVRCAVAAESYFLPWKGYGDGGLAINNPSMAAISTCMRKKLTQPTDIEMLSIGTGETVTNDPVGSTNGWLKLQWGLWILDAMLNGLTDSMHDYFTLSLPLKRYERIQFAGPRWAMDNPEVMAEALKYWSSEIDRAATALRQF